MYLVPIQAVSAAHPSHCAPCRQSTQVAETDGSARRACRGWWSLSRQAAATLLLPCWQAAALSSQLGALAAGNSGGVLLDSKGRLIGVNTAIADPTGDSMQPSFEALSSCSARPQMCLTASGMSPMLSILDLVHRLLGVCVHQHSRLAATLLRPRQIPPLQAGVPPQGLALPSPSTP